MMMKSISAAIGLIAALSGFAERAVAEPETQTAAIERVIQAEMSARGIPGAQLAIVQHNKLVFSGAYGQANLEAATPVTNQSVFPINSISKAVTGVAVMQLVEAGKLDLDAPLKAYLNTLPEAWKEVTVRQALTHVSGLPEIVDDNVRLIDGAEPEAAWARVQQLPLRFDPGTRFAYTQTNYVVVGKVIEKITGQSFSDFVRSRQFNAVGMARTSFIDLAAAKPGAVTLYTFMKLQIEGMKTVGVERSEVPFVRPEPWQEIVRPAGGIQATAADLAAWVIALQQLKLVKRGSLEELSKPQVLKDGTMRGFNATVNGYGLGWPSVRRAAHPAIALIGGERATVFIYPEDDLTVIVLTNLMGAAPQKFADRIAAVYIPGLVVENNK